MFALEEEHFAYLKAILDAKDLMATISVFIASVSTFKFEKSLNCLKIGK